MKVGERRDKERRRRRRLARRRGETKKGEGRERPRGDKKGVTIGELGMERGEKKGRGGES